MHQGTCEAPRMKTALTFVVVLAAACGGKSPKSEAPTVAKTGVGAHGSAMTQFHDALAPRWHAEKGPKRMADTCAAVGDFRANADALAASPAPASSEPASWTTGTKELIEAVGSLDTTCKASDAAAFEPAFERVHTVFHAVMELGGGPEEHEHGKHGEHGEHGPHAM
jgi:hypothetical protein